MTEPQNSLTSLKENLARLLEDETTDYEGILRLAGEISREEPGVVRFTTDAAMVRRLGRELVAKQETALGELVKNAYDADAEVCTVDLVVGFDLETSFEISDDGSGMTRSQLVDGFMRLASDEKVRNPRSPRYGRSRAGKKGIGRFATERLGHALTIVTQTADEATGWTVTIDWDQFGQGEDIGLIANQITPSPKEKPHGTRLSIRRLKDVWSDADLRRVYRYLETLLQPQFADAARRSPDGMEPAALSTEIPGAPVGLPAKDPGFIVTLNRGGDILKPETVASADTEILGQALAVITAHIDNDGHASWSLSCPRPGIELELFDQPIGLGRNVVEPLQHARNVDLKAWYFIQEKRFLGHSLGFVRKQLDEHGGIRVYRNGYRVPPYGDKNDDWLGLDVKNTQIYAPLNSKAFMGFVAVSDPDGINFEETSSREGLLGSAAFEEVRELVHGVLTAAVGRIEARRGLGRKKKPQPTSPDSGEQAAKETEDAIAGVETLLADLADGAGGMDPDRQREVQVLLERLNAAARVTAALSRQRDDLLAELNMMRILASMGLTIAEFTHDFSALAETMELNLGAMVAALPPDSGDRASSLEAFRNQFRQVRAYTAHFNSMTTSNASRELVSIDLYAFARGFAEDLNVMFTRRGLELVVERPVEYDLRTVRMHRSEWSSILLNLLTNAIKAAARAGRQGRFLIRIGREDASVFLDFCDNGDGIPPENRGQVFDAFFTTSGAAPVRASEASRALGTGLGLKIVSDIAESVLGSARILDSAPDGYQTCIRITVPAASDPEPIV